MADRAGVGEQAITESAMNGEIDFSETSNNGWLYLKV
jgi:hypothetical protein